METPLPPFQQSKLVLIFTSCPPTPISPLPPGATAAFLAPPPRYPLLISQGLGLWHPVLSHNLQTQRAHQISYHLSRGRQNKENPHFSFFSTKIIFKKEGGKRKNVSFRMIGFGNGRSWRQENKLWTNFYKLSYYKKTLENLITKRSVDKMQQHQKCWKLFQVSCLT